MDTREGHIRIDGRWIGPNEPCYIIAEGGLNHNGDLHTAKQLVDAARSAGADAIKFQKRKLSEVYQQHLLDNPRAGEQGLQYIVPLLVEFELSDEEFQELAEYSRAQGMTFFCTPWDRSSVDFLERLGVPAHKVGSPDMTNFALIEYISRTGKPLLISTGMSTEDEIRKSLAWLRELQIAQCGVFHCVSTYPVAADEINLRFMQRLREWCPWPIGYSGHEDGIAVSTGAVALGASMLERHITLDRSMRGPDHKASLEPDAFRALVDGVRDVELALGVPHRWISRGEVLNRRALGKSLVAREDIASGTVITADLVGSKSPGMGLSPQRISELVGRRINRSLRRDEMFLDSDLREDTSHRESRQIDLGLPWGVVARFLDLEPLIARFGAEGLSFVELHLSDRDLDAGIEAFTPTRRALDLVIHAPEYCHDYLIDLCAEDEAQRTLSIERIQKTLDLSRRLAAWFDRVDARGPKVVVHVGGMSRAGTAYDKTAAAERLQDSVRRLDRSGVELLLENLPPCPWYFGGRWTGYMLVDGPNTRDMCEATGLGLCFDTSHAALACHVTGETMTEFTRTVAPYVRHLHLSDGAGISGEGLQIGDGQIDFAALWPLLTATAATCVPEIWMGHHNVGSGFHTALDRLADIAVTARALTAAGDHERPALAKLIVSCDVPLDAALRAIEANAQGIVFAVDAHGMVVGVLTDGDVRRHLLAGRPLSTLVAQAMNRDFVFAFSDASRADIDARLSARSRVVPILDSARRLVRVEMLPLAQIESKEGVR